MLGLSKLGEFRWFLFLSQEVQQFPWQISSSMRYFLLVPLLVRDGCVQKGWLCSAWGVYPNFGITLKTGVQELELVSHDLNVMQTLLGKFSYCMTKSQTGKGARAERECEYSICWVGRMRADSLCLQVSILSLAVGLEEWCPSLGTQWL